MLVDGTDVLVVLVILLAHIAGGIAAFGSALLALPFLILLISDLQTSVLLVVACGFIQAVHLFIYLYKDVHKRELVWILLFGGIGLPIGLLVPSLLPGFIVYCILAGLVMFTGLRGLIQSYRTNHPSATQPLRWYQRVIMLVGSGAIHGAFGTGGALLILYSQFVFSSKEHFRATLVVVWLVLNAVMLTILLLNGFMNDRDAQMDRVFLIVLCIPAVVFGSWFAQKVANRLNQLIFFRFTSVLLLISGIAIIIKAMLTA